MDNTHRVPTERGWPFFSQATNCDGKGAVRRKLGIASARQVAAASARAFSRYRLHIRDDALHRCRSYNFFPTSAIPALSGAIATAWKATRRSGIFHAQRDPFPNSYFSCRHRSPRRRAVRRNVQVVPRQEAMLRWRTRVHSMREPRPLSRRRPERLDGGKQAKEHMRGCVMPVDTGDKSRPGYLLARNGGDYLLQAVNRRRHFCPQWAASLGRRARRQDQGVNGSFSSNLLIQSAGSCAKRRRFPDRVRRVGNALQQPTRGRSVDDMLVGHPLRHMKRQVSGRQRDRPRPAMGLLYHLCPCRTAGSEVHPQGHGFATRTRFRCFARVKHSSYDAGKAVSAPDSHQGSWM